MSRDASIVLEFAGEERKFRLGIKQLISLQESTNHGPYVLLDRLRTRERVTRLVEVEDEVAGKVRKTLVRIGLDGEIEPPNLPAQCNVEDIHQVILLGLEGGGLEFSMARKLLKTVVEPEVPEVYRPLAFAVLSVALYGAPDERLGESAAANPTKNPSTASPTES